MPKKTETPSFEASLAQLEEIVASMESGELSLEDSLTAFEKGIKLTRECQKSLEKAEQKVTKLMEKDNTLQEVPFDPNSEND